MNVLRVLGSGAWRPAPTLDKRRFGVPPGGPWDAEAAAYVRSLLGLSRQDRVFELLQGTCDLEIEQDGCLAIVGMDLQLDGEPGSGVRPVSKGARIRISAHEACIAFSAAVLASGNLGWILAGPERIRYLPEMFSEELNVTTSPSFSRSGIRFHCDAKLPVEERPSEPTCVGAIQATPSGEVIVIGPDGPTIGGYPRLGTVISADLDLLPRLKIGQSIKFVPVSFEIALELEASRKQIVNSRCVYLASSATHALG